MTSAIEEIIPAVESPPAKMLLQGEALNRISLGTSLVAAKDLKVGIVLKREHFEIRSPGGGLEPFRMECVLGTTLQQSMRKGEPFAPHLYDMSDEKTVKVDFVVPWGIPVRFHDAASLLGRVPYARVAELHLGREDLNLSLKEAMQDIDLSRYRLVVHSPDIFWSDHLLDLANEDSSYRQRSIRLLQSVIDKTEEWFEFFDTPELPLVVASLGGFSKNQHFDQDSVSRGYEHLSHAIKKLQLGQVELLAQTLPPFPWYFGGQYFCNLFVQPDDTTCFASQENLKLCLDLSHTKMASSFYGFDFLSGVKQLLPFTRHCHVADARGSAGEGVQIGEGDIDFSALNDVLLASQDAFSFVPEIWQGHLSGGGGLAEGLRRLAKLGFLQVKVS
jgi:N-acetylneuraminate synthase